MLRSDFIRTWRDELHLTTKEVAQGAGLAEATVSGIESGKEASVDELESIARVLGLRGEQLFDDEIAPNAGTDVLRVLFKSAEGLKPTQQARLAMLDAARAALDLLDLHNTLKVPKPDLQKLNLQPIPNEPLYKTGKRQAKAMRAQLKLGTKPILSLRDLLTLRLRVPVVAAKFGASGPDAFSVFAPGGRVAVVVNVDGKHENHLVRRFTLAHELGHVCADRPAVGGTGMACLIDSQRQLDIETRANAFAINLLLTQDVERLKERLLEPAIFRQVMEEWGIHFASLRLFVKNLLGLSDERMTKTCPRVDSNAPLTVRQSEELEAERSPLQMIPLPRRGELSRLVLQEYSEGRMSAGRAREFLRVDATHELHDLVRAAGLA